MKKVSDILKGIREGAVPSTEKTVTVKHKSSGKEIRVTQNSIKAYRALGYHPIKEETIEEGAFSSGKLKPPKEWVDAAKKIPSTGTIRDKDSKGVYTSKTVNGKEVSREYDVKEEVEELDESPVVIKTNKEIGAKVTSIGPGGKETTIKTDSAYAKYRKMGSSSSNARARAAGEKNPQVFGPVPAKAFARGVLKDLKKVNVKEEVVNESETHELAIPHSHPYRHEMIGNILKKHGAKHNGQSDKSTYFKVDADKVHAAKSELKSNGVRADHWINGELKEETEQLEEGRPSQRHPLEGHDYHRKTNAELEYIAKDAHKAAEAMKSHNTTAENKYRDQANDSATVRHFRKTSGSPDWYKKKYGLKEEVEPIVETKKTGLEKWRTEAAARDKAHRKFQEKISGLSQDERIKATMDKISKNLAKEGLNPNLSVDEQKQNPKIYADSEDRPTAKSPNAPKVTEQHAELGKFKPVVPHNVASTAGGRTRATSDSANVSLKEDKMNKKDNVPFDKPYSNIKKTITDKSGAKHTPMSRARDLARATARKQAGLKEADTCNSNAAETLLGQNNKITKESSKAGIVRKTLKDAKERKETKGGKDKFEADPELTTQIVRND